MIRSYLLKRKKNLQEILDVNTNKYDHNEIAIAKNEKQIRELLNEVDEATNIFSVVAREDSGFKSKEIAEIEGKIAIYRDDNIETEKIINQAKNEIEIIKKCLDELELEEKCEIEETYHVSNDDPVVYEEKDSTSEQIINKEIIERLKLCKSLVGVDPRRTAIELDNLIKKYE